MATQSDGTGGPAGIARAGVVGAGVMGRGIAQVLAVAGVDVAVVDARPGTGEEAVSFVAGMLGRAVEKGRLEPAVAAAATERVRAVGTRVDALGGCDLVVEAVVEDLAVKRALFAAVEQAVGADALLATNTSSLSVTDIAAGLRRPGRLCGLHFFNPVPLMRLVEVVPGERTAPEVVDRLLALVERVGHTPVRVADTPGFLVNHLGRAYSTEALRLVDERVATPYDVDRVLREAAGFRMGPFELFDLTGLDVSQPVMETVYRGFYEEPRLRPSPTARRRLAAGRLGRKSGDGWYAYRGGTADVPPEPALPPYGGRPVWVSRAEPDGTALAGLLRGGGADVDASAEPSAAAVALVTPWGGDVTATVVAQGLDPSRALGVDPFGGFGGRLTLATTPATSPDAVATALAALGATGRPVTRTADSPGFVAQRVVAAVVNLACEVAQLGLAAPADIDTAVRLALGYPRGPLAWGDEIGPDTVVRTLEGLVAATGDPRYRPSPWLRRRAALGVSLRVDEHR